MQSSKGPSFTKKIESERGPLIGLLAEIEKPTADWEGTKWTFPQCNLDVLRNAGAKPFFVQYDLSRIPEFVERLDGVLLPGNVFDIANYENLAKSAKERLVFEMKLVTEMFRVGKPVFGICGGMQAVGKLLGGIMINHIPDEVEGDVSHNYKDYRGIAHEVDITSGSFMYTASRNKTKIGTNGIHHQGFEDLPQPFEIAARTQDGVIEAMSLKDSRGKIIFFGTQFHPEINNRTGKPGDIITDTDIMYNNLLTQFVERAKERAKEGQKYKPEYTAKLVKQIESIKAVLEVEAVKPKDDWDPAVIMPSAAAADNDNKKVMCGVSTQQQRKSVSSEHNRRESLVKAGQQLLRQAFS